MTAAGRRSRPTLRDVDVARLSRLVADYCQLAGDAPRLLEAFQHLMHETEEVLPGREFDDFRDAIGHFQFGAPGVGVTDIVRTFGAWRRLVQVAQRAVLAQEIDQRHVQHVQARLRGRRGGRPKSDAADHARWASEFDRLRKRFPALPVLEVCALVAEAESPDLAKPLSRYTIRNCIGRHRKAAKSRT